MFTQWIVTIFGKSDSQKCLIWSVQLAFEASEGLLDIFTAICYILINTPKGAQAAAACRGVWGTHSCMWFRGSFCSTHTIVAKAAQLFGQPPDCLNVCLADLAEIAVIIYLGDHHNDQGRSISITVHYDSLRTP